MQQIKVQIDGTLTFLCPLLRICVEMSHPVESREGEGARHSRRVAIPSTDFDLGFLVVDSPSDGRHCPNMGPHKAVGALH